MQRALVTSLILATAAAGCGGGGKPATVTAPTATAPAPPPPAPAPPPTSVNLEGVFSGSIGSGRSFNGAVLHDGSIFGIYSVAGSALVVGGLIQGNGTSSASTSYSSSNIKDFSVEGSGVRDGSLSSTFEASLFFNGTTTYAITTFASLAFTTSIFASTTPASLATVAGNYSGTYGESPAARQTLTLTVTSTGAISGASGTGCRINGTVSPRALDNNLDLSITFGSAPCTMPTATISGLVINNTSTHVLYGGATSSDRSKAAVFILQRS